MAQFLTLLSVLLHFTLFSLMVFCTNGQIYSERRDRAPYIDSSEHSTQYLTDSTGPAGSRLRKGSIYRENNANFRIQEQQVEAPRAASHSHIQSNRQLSHNDDATTDSIVDTNIRNIFSTNFGPGLYLFKDKVETTSLDYNRRGDNVTPHTVDTKDCVESDGKSGKPFCTRLRNYPEQSHLEEIIKTKFANLESFFGEDLLLPQNISQRMNNEPNEKFLCESRTRVIYPEAGLNKDYNWLFIINTQKYKQGIRIEECINEGSICGENSGLQLANRYTVTCKQSYIYRSLVAYTNETIIKDQFKMPSCCKCVLTMS